MQVAVQKAFGDRDFPPALGSAEEWYGIGSSGLIALMCLEPLHRYDGPLTLTSQAEREQRNYWKAYAGDEDFITDLRTFRCHPVLQEDGLFWVLAAASLVCLLPSDSSSDSSLEAQTPPLSF